VVEGKGPGNTLTQPGQKIALLFAVGLQLSHNRVVGTLEDALKLRLSMDINHASLTRLGTLLAPLKTGSRFSGCSSRMDDSEFASFRVRVCAGTERRFFNQAAGFARAP